VKVPVAEAARILEERGQLHRRRFDQSERLIPHVAQRLGCALPDDLVEFYRERIGRVGDFDAIFPIWNDYVGWRPEGFKITDLLHVGAVPLFSDGCASLYGLDLTSVGQTPAVYFFDKDDGYSKPQWAAGSSLGTFLLLLADFDQSYAEHWPMKWQLDIDPDIDRCPRARAIWAAD